LGFLIDDCGIDRILTSAYPCSERLLQYADFDALVGIHA